MSSVAFGPLFGLGFLFAAVGASAAPAPAGPLEPQSGTWLSADGLSKVKIGPCGISAGSGQTYCATIVWVRPPVKPEDQETFEKKRKFIGTAISSDLHHAEDNLLVGMILNPESGKTYNAKIRLKSANALEMGGCILGGLLCGSETWARTTEEAAAPATRQPARTSGVKPAPKTTGSAAAVGSAPQETVEE